MFRCQKKKPSYERVRESQITFSPIITAHTFNSWRFWAVVMLYFRRSTSYMVVFKATESKTVGQYEESVEGGRRLKLYSSPCVFCTDRNQERRGLSSSWAGS